MTVVTPITTPRMVSADRSLLARRASRAIATPSPTFRMPMRQHACYSARSAVIGIEPRGAGGGEDAEDDAGARAQRQGDAPPTRG